MKFPFEDFLGDDGRIDENLHGGSAPVAFAGADQALGHDGAEVARQIHQELLAPFFGEEIHDAIDGLIGAVRVQRAKTQMPRFCEGDGMIHGFRVADLTDQNDIRRLPQGVLEGMLPRKGVNAQFPVRDQGLFRLVNEFHRVFHRNDVTG